jgi:hypothetical protein
MAWTAPRDWTAGENVTEAMMDTHVRDNLNYLNDLRVKYAQSTSDSSSTSSTTILDVLSAPSFTPISSSRLLKITGHWRGLNVATDPGIYGVHIREGSTTLNSENKKVESTGTGQQGGTIVCYVASPSAAAHTYKLSLQRLSGTGTAVMEGAATYPIQIIVEDIGAA